MTLNHHIDVGTGMQATGPLEDDLPVSESPSPSAILVQGPIYTAAKGSAASVWAEAAVIAEGKFTCVGTLLEATSCCQRFLDKNSGGRVQEIKAPEGGLILPGFIDAHCHPLAAGTREMNRETYCDLSQAQDLGGALELCKRYMKSQYNGEPWVLGGGWRDDWFPDRTPRAEQLDEIFGKDVAVMLRRWDMHASWCSTKALEVAGLLVDGASLASLCPRDGKIVTDASNRPVGLLYDAAQDLILRAIPPLTQEVRMAALKLALDRMMSLGITGYLEALVKNDRQLAVYQQLYADEDMASRLPWGRLAMQCRSLQDVQALKQKMAWTGERLHLGMAKLMVDGVMESKTAALHAPYRHPSSLPQPQTEILPSAQLPEPPPEPPGDPALPLPPTRQVPSTSCRCCGSGMLNFTTEELTQVVSEIDAARISIHCHCVGDRATSEVLDALEVARGRNGAWDARHTIAHLQLVRPSDVPRFQPLGVVANFTPYWICTTDEMERVINPALAPPERAEQQYPIKDILETGAEISFGSDWPVDDVLSPLTGLQVAVTHVAPYSSYAPWLPHQVLTLRQAVDAYTIDAAYACHAEETTGSIAVGKDADLIVLDKDIFRLQSNDISTARIVSTTIKGTTVYQT